MSFANPACAYSDADFFPGSGVSARPAIAVCHTCQHEKECLAAALAAKPWDDHGVLGGTTRRQRARIRKGVECLPTG